MYYSTIVVLVGVCDTYVDHSERETIIYYVTGGVPKEFLNHGSRA